MNNSIKNSNIVRAVPGAYRTPARNGAAPTLLFCAFMAATGGAISQGDRRT